MHKVWGVFLTKKTNTMKSFQTFVFTAFAAVLLSLSSCKQQDAPAPECKVSQNDIEQEIKKVANELFGVNLQKNLYYKNTSLSLCEIKELSQKQFFLASSFKESVIFSNRAEEKEMFFWQQIDTIYDGIKYPKIIVVTIRNWDGRTEFFSSIWVE